MPRILLVENDVPSRTFMAEVLDEEGYTVILADDGMHALDCFTRASPHLIITSVMLPNLDGLMLCRQLRQNPATAHIPIIICSAAMEMPDPSMVPYEAFLEKPFDLTAFIRLVAAFAPPTG